MKALAWTQPELQHKFVYKHPPENPPLPSLSSKLQYLINYRKNIQWLLFVCGCKEKACVILLERHQQTPFKWTIAIKNGSDIIATFSLFSAHSGDSSEQSDSSFRWFGPSTMITGLQAIFLQF